tara:strand:+ start:325 stop:924 length:600 start_codon:yes stop_codon:yes gene_type:complete
MKKLHRSDLFGWSIFNEERNIDFNSTLWVRSQGNVIIDPLPLIEHDKKHLESLGGAAHVIITNSDHIRDAAIISSMTGAKCWAPLAEKEQFPLQCDGWLQDGDEPISGIEIFSFNGSKTPGELAVLMDETTLITGDLIRAHEGGCLCIIPDAKLKNKDLAVKSIKRMVSIKKIQAVIPGDGWPVFNQGHEALFELSEKL